MYVQNIFQRFQISFNFIYVLLKLQKSTGESQKKCRKPQQSIKCRSCDLITLTSNPPSPVEEMPRAT